MGKYVIAKQLAGKRVVTNDGEDLGKLVDLIVNEINGKITTVVVEANPDNSTARKMKKEDGYIMIPYNSVLAVADYIIVDKKGIAM